MFIPKLSISGIALVLLIGIAIFSNICICVSGTENIKIPTQAENESQYFNLTNALWGYYNEDLSYSSEILDEYVRSNITRQEALEAITSTIVLNSKAADTVAELTPPEMYRSYNENTANAFAYFQAYLFNLAKYYQTGNTAYASEARDLFNGSLEYHDKAIESQIGIK
jgi:hypothetical protein